MNRQNKIKMKNEYYINLRQHIHIVLHTYIQYTYAVYYILYTSDLLSVLQQKKDKNKIHV